VMRAGRIEQIGTPQEVYRAPRTAFVARFIGGGNVLPVTIEDVRERRACVRVAGVLVLEVDLPDDAPAFARGAAAALLARPEHVELHVAPPQDGALAVRVAATAFQGATVRVVVRTASGDEIVALARPDEPAAHLAPGSDAWLRLPARHLRLLPADG